MPTPPEDCEQIPEPVPPGETEGEPDPTTEETVEETAESDTVRARARARLFARAQVMYIRLRNVGDVLVWLGGPVLAGLRFGRRWAFRAGWRRWGPGVLAALQRGETDEAEALDAERAETDPEECR